MLLGMVYLRPIQVAMLDNWSPSRGIQMVGSNKSSSGSSVMMVDHTGQRDDGGAVINRAAPTPCLRIPVCKAGLATGIKELFRVFGQRNRLFCT